MPRSDHARVAAAIRILAERFLAPPSLDALAQEVGLSPAHFQRMFRRATGVSPKRFTQSLVADRAERLLRETTVLEAAHGAGLSGPGRLHDLTVNVRAMTPGELRRGGEGLSIAWGLHETPFGVCAIATTERGVCELTFVEDGLDPEAALRQSWPRAGLTRDEARTAHVAAAVLDASRCPGPLTLHLKGTNFQLRVWKALLAIPAGRVTSYGAIAQALDAPTASRAVGGAVGANPVSLIIPCHRVLRAHGALGGYRWGLDRKRAILAWEGAREAG